MKYDFKENIHTDSIIGEVFSANEFLCEVIGLSHHKVGAMILFESNSLGFIQKITEEYSTVVLITNLGVMPGETALLYRDDIEIPVGDKFLGRVIDVFGNPIDQKGKIESEYSSPIFRPSYPIIERDSIVKQIETGIILVDSLFPLAYGQREVILGGMKTGKTTFLKELIANQSTDVIVIYVLIGKKADEVDDIVSYFEENKVLSHTVVVYAPATSLPSIQYLSAYSGCSMGEYFWEKGKDVIVVYDDLTTHAKSYREISLVSGISPGRDSYPADIFSIHSKLIERSGRTARFKGSMSALPVVSIQNNDLTGYISTNIMSMTDGHLFFDTESYLKGIRPAINSYISVSRIGKRVQDSVMKEIADDLNLALIKYQDSEKLAHFETSLSSNILDNLYLGDKIYALFRQEIGERFTLFEEKVLLSLVLYTPSNTLNVEDIPYAKKRVKELSKIENFRKENLTDNIIKFLVPAK